MTVAEIREASFNRKVETFNARKFAAQNFTQLIRIRLIRGRAEAADAGF